MTIIQSLTQGAVFLGESINGFVISDHTVPHYQKKNGRSKKGLFTKITACPLAPRGKNKKQHTDPRREDKKRNKSNISSV